MFAVTMLAILLTMALALARAVLGPTVADRVLGVNMFGTKTVLLIAVISFFTDRLDFLDLGLVYALMNFIGVLAVLRLISGGRLGGAAGPGAPSGEEADR